LVIAQRLTPGLCPEAGVPVKIESSIKLMIEKQFADLPQKYVDKIDFTDKVYKAGESADCPNGTRGRIAVMEVLEMDKDIELGILKGASEGEIYKIARSNGMLTMKEDAIIKTMHQVIPFEEVSNL
jgi:type IV pilus assembly protein PilB